MRAAAVHWFGFVPVSPDGAAYRSDRGRDEVVNDRHGSPGRPKLHRDLDETSPLARLLGRLESVRADMRFRDDGVLGTVTVQRKPAGK